MEGTSRPVVEPSFEDELKNLERVVGLLERGELDLWEAIRQYESGHQSLKRCYQVLERAQKRIEILTAGASSAGLAADSPGDPAGDTGRADGRSSASRPFALQASAGEGENGPGWRPAEFPPAADGASEA